ncbi:hypothetical protein [Amycolatopsis magusensis]|uniref:Uncharacterized protein n=1 Tax=Amycolatopsis magusensis TaxID=882444 RepID=A0ABS4PYG8_9PSEU|nr:hypothetical protein [Amycolatopsis magusensis]MBP2183879.1 hypothetical protein [Amycolatopsis magusensis]
MDDSDRSLSVATMPRRAASASTVSLLLATGSLALLLGTWCLPWAREFVTDGARQHIAMLGLATLAAELGRRLWRISRAALQAKVRRFVLEEHE